jgi:hypothetical protein
VCYFSLYGPIVSLTFILDFREDLSLNKIWSLDFSPLSSINILSHQQNTINRRLRLRDKVWIGTALRVLLTRAPAPGQQLANDFRQPGQIPFMASESFPFFFGRLR